MRTDKNGVGYKELFPLVVKIVDETSQLDLIFDRLVNYDRYGFFDKKFIRESGPHLAGLKQYPDNIKIKFKRNFFIQINSDGNIYLIDTFKEKNDEYMSSFVAGGVEYRGVQLINWKKHTMPQLLNIIDKWIKSPQMIINLALSKLNPVVVAKIKTQSGRLIRGESGNPITLIHKRDIGEWISNGIVVDTKNKQREPQKIKVR